jgi:hypothetical protein
MARGAFDVSFVLSLVSLVLAIPFIHEVYKDSFDYNDWNHIVRMSLFGIVPFISILGMVAAIRDKAGLAKWVLTGYLLSFPVPVYLFLFGIIEATTTACSEIETL